MTEKEYRGIGKEKGFILFIVISVVAAFVWFVFFGGDNIRGDGEGYYEYFIRFFITRSVEDSGIIRFPMGTALLQLPFHLTAFLFTYLSSGQLPDGMEIQFHAAASIAAFFYWTMGIWISYRLLRKKFSQWASLLSCICISVGTMMIEYVLDMTSYSHAYGFFLCTLFFAYVTYYEEKRNEKNKAKLDFGLGLLLGVIVLVRNTNIIIGAAYLFYKVTDLKGFGSRLKAVMDKRLILQVTGCMIPIGVQLVLWRIMAGRWIIYSYEDQGFPYLFKPQIIRVLFSDAKGLFIFCPILIVAVIAMIVFRNENPEYRVSQWVIFASVTYIIAAWWCWWLGSSYGERMYTDVLCIFIIPFASFFENIGKLWKEGTHKSCKVVVSILAMFCLFFVALNIIWFVGCRQSVISTNFATWYQLRKMLLSLLG